METFDSGWNCLEVVPVDAGPSERGGSPDAQCMLASAASARSDRSRLSMDD